MQSLYYHYLLHDDIQDQDPERYGQPTVHIRYGEAMAINIGDLLLGEGYRLLASLQNKELLGVVARAHVSLCLGQGAELAWQLGQKVTIDDDALHHIAQVAGQEEDKGDFLVRYEEETTYRFVESGTFDVTLICRLSDTGELVDSASVVVAISESRLEFPNAFSPNDDKINDRYGAKGVNDPQSPSHWKSIVEFHAYIFNRWGQKLYEWTDPAGSWDGTFNGHPVKEGVYYVLVKAKGADGRVYNIRKDVNLLRGYHETGNSTNTQ